MTPDFSHGANTVARVPSSSHACDHTTARGPAAWSVTAQGKSSPRVGGTLGGGGQPRLGEQEGRRSVKKRCGARKGRGGAVGGAFSASKLPGHRGGPLGWKDGPAPDFWATACSKDIRDREASVFCVVGCSCFLHFRSLKKWSKQSRKAKPDEFLIQTALHFAVLKYF